MPNSSPRPVILDVDTGYDDALALLLALRTPALQVLGITCVHGNQTLDQVVVNTLKVLDAAGAPDIPVAAGMRHPLIETVRPPSLIHGHDGLADLDLPPSSRRVVDLHAVEFLRRQLSQATEPVTIIALAPLTNIAVLWRMYPELAEKIAGLTIMGGTYIDFGNTAPVSEFNIRVDPEAAAIVLQSGLPIKLYPLDVFRQIRFYQTEIPQFQAGSDPAAQMAGGIFAYACAHFQADYSLIGDAGAVATVIDPAGATFERAPISVELSGSVTRGQTVLDRRAVPQQMQVTEWWKPPKTEIEVVTAVDIERYRTMFREAMFSRAR